MKQQIKKIALILLVVVLLSVGGFLYYQRLGKQEQNYQFARDVVHSLIEIRASRGDKEREAIQDEELEFLRGAYLMQEHLLNAKDDVEKWSNHQNSQISEIANDMLKGIDNLLVASDSYIKVATRKSKSDKEDLTIFQINLEEGRKKIMVAPTNIGVNGLSLSSSQKRDLIEYIENAFEQDIAERDEQVRKGEEVVLREEVVAALLIKMGLEGVGD